MAGVTKGQHPRTASIRVALGPCPASSAMELIESENRGAALLPNGPASFTKSDKRAMAGAENVL